MLMTRGVTFWFPVGPDQARPRLLNALIELLPRATSALWQSRTRLELRIDHSNCVRFEARGLQEGAVTIRDLVRHALAASTGSYRGGRGSRR